MMNLGDTQVKGEFLFKDEASGTEVWMKRLDRQYAQSIGNKAYKLRYNVAKAKVQGSQALLTFAGAYSNHIAAVALIGKKENIPTIGIIRGEELGVDLAKTLDQNVTLRKAKENGMRFEFISRKDYRNKDREETINHFKQKYGNVFILPEGGTNSLAVKGCEEILGIEDRDFDYICCPVGTGGTLSGIINSSFPIQKILGFCALKTDMNKSVANYTSKNNWEIYPESYFGGFAKINLELISFINRFKDDYGVLLDPIYTGKMMYSLIDKVKGSFFGKNKRILAIHTGGLQGIEGMNQRLIRKKLPTIEK